MTYTRYLLCSLGISCGFSRKNIWMSDAAAEAHLLKEAETHLGESTWKNVQSIEALSMEYWKLRKLVKEHERVASKLTECQQTLEQVHIERVNHLGSTDESFEDLSGEKRKRLADLEALARERDVIVAKAREIRKTYEGMKMKQDVLKEGGHSDEENQQISSQLSQLKEEFMTVKAQRQSITEKIEAGDSRIDAIEDEIRARKSAIQGTISEEFQNIGEANQKVSKLRAELGLLDTQMRQLYSEIGRYVSQNFRRDPACRTACRKNMGLLNVMQAIKKSIHLNHKLANFT